MKQHAAVEKEYCFLLRAYLPPILQRAPFCANGAVSLILLFAGLLGG